MAHNHLPGTDPLIEPGCFRSPATTQHRPSRAWGLLALLVGVWMSGGRRVIRADGWEHALVCKGAPRRPALLSSQRVLPAPPPRRLNCGAKPINPQQRAWDHGPAVGPAAAVAISPLRVFPHATGSTDPPSRRGQSSTPLPVLRSINHAARPSHTAGTNNRLPSCPITRSKPSIAGRQPARAGKRSLVWTLTFQKECNSGRKRGKGDKGRNKQNKNANHRARKPQNNCSFHFFETPDGAQEYFLSRCCCLFGGVERDEATGGTPDRRAPGSRS